MFFYNMGLAKALKIGNKFLQQERRQEAEKYFKIVGEEQIVDWELFAQQYDREICDEVLDQAFHKGILCYPQKGSFFIDDEYGGLKNPVNYKTSTVYHFSTEREAERYKKAKYPTQSLGLAKLIKPVI